MKDLKKKNRKKDGGCGEESKLVLRTAMDENINRRGRRGEEILRGFRFDEMKEDGLAVSWYFFVSNMY